MPPGQPVHRCAACGLLRPCRPVDGGWRCRDCHPHIAVVSNQDDQDDQHDDDQDEVTETAVDDELEPPEKPVATDGGDHS